MMNISEIEKTVKMLLDRINDLESINGDYKNGFKLYQLDKMTILDALESLMKLIILQNKIIEKK